MLLEMILTSINLETKGFFFLALSSFLLLSRDCSIRVSDLGKRL